MRHLPTFLLFAASAFAQTATITDTIATPFAGTFSGTVTVTLNSPALAQPLYSGNVTLSGWTQTVTVTAGAFTLTLYTNDLITPGGTSYTATYAPTSGTGWKETWIVPTGATTIREIRSTTVPSPSVRFTPSQITQAGATLGQGLKWDGSKWAPADVVANPMTTNGDLITRLGGVPVRVGIGSTNQVLTVAGGMPVWASGITGNASTATALAANGTNCSAGSYPLGVDASGNAEGCTAAVTASTGLSDSSALVRNNQANTYTAGSKQTFASNATTAGAAFGGGITADPSSVTAGDFWYRTDLGTFGFRNASAVDALVAGGRALSTVGSVPFVTSSGVLGQSVNLFWSSANNRLGINTNTPAAALDVAGDVFIRTGNRITADTFDNYTGGSTAMTVRTGGNQALVFGTNNTERARFVGSTGNFLLGTGTDDGVNRLQVAGSANFRPVSGTNVQITGAATFGQIRSWANDGTTPQPLFLFGAPLTLNHGASGEVARTTSNLNLLLGTTTDGNFRLDVASSGSSGTTRIYDQTPTTGSTSLVVRAGAGQSGNLQTWQNSGGTEVARVNAGGGVAAQEFFNLTGTFYQNGVNVDVGSGGIYRFASSASQGATKDLSLSRASANTLQVGDGGANANGAVNARSIALATSAAFGTHITFDTNTGADGIITSSSAGSLQFGTTNVGPLVLIHNNVELLQLSSNTVTITNPTPTIGSSSLVVRAGAGQGSNNLTTWQNSGGSTIASISSSGDILARIHTWANGTEGTCDATLRGQVVMVQGGAGVADTFRVCRKDATDTYLWAPVDNNVALQVISAGPTATVTNQVRRVYVDPVSVIASLTLTLPASPLDADQVQVFFGGTIANQAAVVTTLSIAPNTGHAISQFNAPANAFGGDMVTYEYRAAAARWYRIQ